MSAKTYSSELFAENLSKYGVPGIFKGTRMLPYDFDMSKNLMDCDDELLELFAETAKIEDSSASNYFRGEYPNGEVFDIEYIHYDI